MRGRRALSLVEVTISFFLLMSVILMTASLYVSSLGFGQNSEENALGATLASAKLAEIRAWGADPDNYLSNWSPYDNVSSYAPDQPDYEVRVRCNAYGLDRYTPCNYEAGQAGDARLLPRGLVAVRVEVQKVGSRQISTLNGWVGQPLPEARPVNAMELSPSVIAPLAANQSVTVSVAAFDSASRPIQGLEYHWSLEAITGNARLSPTGFRDRRSVILTNVSTRVDGTPGVLPGLVRLRCEAFLGGRPLEVRSTEIVMQP